jgi:Ca2+-transporting ATPase
MHPFSNKYLVGATITVIFLQLLALYTPFFQHFLRTYPLTLHDWLVILPVASSIIVVEEIRKFFYRKKILQISN